MGSVAKVHVFYVISILLAVIVGLVTVEWGQIPELVDYINFALTCTSMALAIIAIVHAFYANSDTARQMGALQDATRQMQESAGNILRSSTELDERVAAIPPLLREVGDGMSRTQEMLTVFQNKAAPTLVASTPPAGGPVARGADVMVRVASPMGRLVYFVLAVAHDTKKAFSLDDVTTKFFDGERDYFFGWTMAADSLGYVDIGMSKNWTVGSMDSALKAEVEKRAAGLEEAGDVDGTWSAPKVAAVRAYFASLGNDK